MPHCRLASGVSGPLRCKEICVSHSVSRDTGQQNCSTCQQVHGAMLRYPPRLGQSSIQKGLVWPREGPVVKSLQNTSHDLNDPPRKLKAGNFAQWMVLSPLGVEERSNSLLVCNSVWAELLVSVRAVAAQLQTHPPAVNPALPGHLFPANFIVLDSTNLGTSGNHRAGLPLPPPKLLSFLTAFPLQWPLAGSGVQLLQSPCSLISRT